MQGMEGEGPQGVEGVDGGRHTGWRVGRAGYRGHGRPAHPAKLPHPSTLPTLAPPNCAPCVD